MMWRSFAALCLLGFILVGFLTCHELRIDAPSDPLDSSFAQVSDQDLKEARGKLTDQLRVLDRRLEELADRGEKGARELEAARQEKLSLARTLSSVENESSRRSNAKRVWFYVAMVVSVVALFEVNRRVLLATHPLFGKKKKPTDYKRLAEDQALREKTVREARLSRVDPRLSRLVPGESNKAMVVKVLGQPDETIAYTELETWTYFLPAPTPAGAPKSKDQELGELWGENVTPVSVIFKGNMVHDLSVGEVVRRTKPKKIQF